MTDLLLDRTQLVAAVAEVGGEMEERKLAHAMKALGVHEQESRPLPSPQRGRTKHYFPETAWALAALSDASVSDLRSMTNLLAPYREIWIRLDEEMKLKTSWLPRRDQADYWALLLFAFGLEHGREPFALAERLRSHDGWTNVSSLGPDFIRDVVSAYLAAYGTLVATALSPASPDRQQLRFAAAYVEHLADRHSQ